MKVKTITKFNDKLANTTREVGEEFEVEVERYEQIMAYRPDLIEPIEEEPPADPEAGEQPKGEDPEKVEEPKQAKPEAPAEGGEGEKPAEGTEPPADPEAGEQPKGEDPEAVKTEPVKEAKPAAKKSQRKNASK